MTQKKLLALSSAGMIISALVLCSAAEEYAVKEPQDAYDMRVPQKGILPNELEASYERTLGWINEARNNIQKYCEGRGMFDHADFMYFGYFKKGERMPSSTIYSDTIGDWLHSEDLPDVYVFLIHFYQKKTKTSIPNSGFFYCNADTCEAIGFSMRE